MSHLNHVNKNNAGIQPTTHREDHNNTHTNAPQKGNGKNTRDKDGTITHCSICESINHWAPNCADNQNQNNTYYKKIVLNQTDYDHPSKLL